MNHDPKNVRYWKPVNCCWFEITQLLQRRSRWFETYIHTGRPSRRRSDDNGQRMRDVFNSDRMLSVWMITLHIGIEKMNAHPHYWKFAIAENLYHVGPENEKETCFFVKVYLDASEMTIFPTSLTHIRQNIPILNSSSETVDALRGWLPLMIQIFFAGYF